MAKKYYIALTNGASVIANGWCDPILRTHYHLLPAYASAKYDQCTGTSTGVSSGPTSQAVGRGRGAPNSTLGGGGTLSATQRGAALGNSGATQFGNNPNAAGAPDAVDLNVPQIGPGGRGFRLPASEIRNVLPRREILFRGVDSVAPESQLGEGVSPHSINFDSFRVPGSLCVRDGLVKMSEDVDTLTPTNTYALGIAAIPAVDPTQNGPCMALLTFGNAAFSGAPSSGNVSLAVASLSPLGRGIVSAKNRPGPALTLTGGSGTLDVTVEGWDGSDQYQIESDSIVAVTVVYSAENYETDPEASRSDRAGVVLADKTRWDGYTDKVLTQVTGLVAGTYYVTAWAWTHTGQTKPTYKKVTVS